MKKTLFVLLIALGFAVGMSARAEASCSIVWSGDLSGSVETEETSRTQQAALEARGAIFYTCSGPYVSDLGCDDECCTCEYSHYYIYQYYIVCYSGEYKETAVVFNDDGPPSFYLYAQGVWDVVCDQTLIQLSSFTATPKSGEVVLSWSTESEIDNVGFNIYRAESEDGEYIKINDALIPTQGSPTQGAAYSFIDENVKNRKTYYYKLEDIDLNGVSTMHGPISATPRLINVFR